MKIGIGVTTYNRPEHFKMFHSQVMKNWVGITNPKYIDNRGEFLDNNSYPVYKSDDSTNRLGIAARKNECLRALKDCDYIFLFDDDCFPIKAGWAEFFIEAHKASGQHHFMYLKDTPGIKKINTYLERKDELSIEAKYIVDEYNNCSGCMMFLTKEVIKQVGAYNPQYGIYGFEHAGYSNRIHSAGLTPLGAYTCPSGASDYIYSLDFDTHLPFNKQIKHEPSMASEIGKLPLYAALNKRVYDNDTDIFIPLSE